MVAHVAVSATQLFVAPWRGTVLIMHEPKNEKRHRQLKALNCFQIPTL